VPFHRPYTTFYWSAIVNIALSCTILSYLTLNNIVTLKSWLEATQGHSNWYHSKAWVWCNRLDRIPACDGQIDRQTDGRTDILPRHSPRYALHTRRAVKFVKCKLSNCECCIQTHRVSAGRATKSFHIFTARRVCIARTTPSQDVRPSVCLSVCLSVTLRYSV